jgi:hypothetical protein
MSQLPEIILPAGTHTVTVSDIPYLLASALYPEQPQSPYILKCITKHFGKDPYRHSPPCEGEELRLVTEIAGTPPLVGRPIAKADLEAYLTRFNTSPRRPEWTIGASVVNENLSAELNRMSAEDEHRKGLKKAIRAGSFVPLNHARLPLDASIREALDLGQVFVESFVEYAVKFGIKVIVSDARAMIEVDNGKKTDLVEASKLITDSTSKLLDAHAERWQKQGHNNEIRRDIASAFQDRRLLDLMRDMVDAGTVVPRNPKDGSPINGPFDFGFACDIYWSLTRNDARSFTQLASVFPKETESELDAAAITTETRRRVNADQLAAKTAAGRHTLKEAVAELARATGWYADRWRNTILEAVRKGELPLRNPGDYSDRLPYTVPKQIFFFIEQVDADGLNGWLELHPEWGITFRFSSPAKGESTVATGAKVRRDILDPAIDKAIKAASTRDTASVWLQLKELALKEEPPFTGNVDNGELLYTDSNNKLESFTINALAKRLKRRVQAAAKSR